MKKTLFVVLSFLYTAFSFGQISHGGLPPSFTDRLVSDEIYEFIIPRPELSSPDHENGAQLKPVQTGVLSSAEIDLLKSGTWQELKGGGRICRLKISSEGAEALGVYYSNFHLPEGGQLFLYNENRTKVIGAFTSANNIEGGAFATEPLPGNSLILEYYQPANVKESAEVIINEIGYLFKFNNYDNRGFGDSGPCEVNVNCPEGINWKEQRNSVVRILLKQSSSLFWCTGSLINNTNLDNKPYIYTANHCGKTASPSDYEQWVFYFNYQSPDCEDPQNQPDAPSITGANLKAKSLDNEIYGSDFKLLLLNNEVPQDYHPFFNGWYREDVPSPSGVGIHHPQGDIKKISTYYNEVISSRYQGSQYDPDGKYWKVYWSETVTNHGVTEGGSSGSALVNNDGLIVGQLTGGAASCTNLNGPDYYGKFSFSWESNGIYDSLQLKPWLDPQNTGVNYLSGIGPDVNEVVAIFKTDHDTIAIGERIKFEDLSTGDPTHWEWTFEGGTPSTSIQEDPVVTYNSYGSFNVKLVVRNDESTDTLMKNDIIHVMPNIYPNPATTKVNIYFGQENTGPVDIYIYNSIGRLIEARGYNLQSSDLELDIQHFRNDIYFFQIVKGASVTVQKVVKMGMKK